MPAARRLKLWRAVLVAALAAVLLLPPSAALGASSLDRVPAPERGRPWFGPGLNWVEDLPADYAGRLGETPALYAHQVQYPLTEDDATYVAQFAEQAATHGAVAVLSLTPATALTDLTECHADELADELARLHEQLDTYFLVRFAPEMNGSWVAWGQQPPAFVRAFRTVAAAVHDATDHASMVWSPVYGSGYPFGRVDSAIEPSGARDEDALDTDGNGLVDGDDDPYGPYYPGDAAVDWVGVSLYDLGDRQSSGKNVPPIPGEFEARLDETWGYGDDARRTPFYERFAEGRDQRMLVETGAFYNPRYDGGASELTIKRAWWRQVLAATANRPLIGGISWLELKRAEAETDDQPADWRSTHTPALARALRADLDDSGVGLGPVTRVLEQPSAGTATPGARSDADGPLEAGDQRSWFIVPVALLAVALAGLARTSWARTRRHGTP